MKISRRDLKRLIESYVNETPLGMGGITFGGNVKMDDPWEFDNLDAGVHDSPEEKAAATYLSTVQAAVNKLGIMDGNDVQLQHQGVYDPVSVMFVSPANLAILVGPEGEPEKIRQQFSKKSPAEIHKLVGPASDLYDEVARIAQSPQKRGTAFDASNKKKGTITGRGHTALFVVQ